VLIVCVKLAEKVPALSIWERVLIVFKISVLVHVVNIRPRQGSSQGFHVRSGENILDCTYHIFSSGISNAANSSTTSCN
jgi:uncharacterized membrane protein YagU involved in acid resistance